MKENLVAIMNMAHAVSKADINKIETEINKFEIMIIDDDILAEIADLSFNVTIDKNDVKVTFNIVLRFKNNNKLIEILSEVNARLKDVDDGNIIQVENIMYNYILDYITYEKGILIRSIVNDLPTTLTDITISRNEPKNRLKDLINFKKFVDKIVGD